MSLSPATLRELRAVLERTEADIAALEQYAEHLRGVLKFAPPTEAQDQGRQERASATFKMTPVREEAERILREAGEPLHYREIHRRLVERGIEVRGKDPARTVGAQLSADDERFYSIGANTGKWALVEWKALPPHSPILPTTARRPPDAGPRDCREIAPPKRLTGLIDKCIINP